MQILPALLLWAIHCTLECQGQLLIWGAQGNRAPCSKITQNPNGESRALSRAEAPPSTGLRHMLHACGASPARLVSSGSLLRSERREGLVKGLKQEPPLKEYEVPPPCAPMFTESCSTGKTPCHHL